MSTGDTTRSKDAVFYELRVGSFADGGGDGIGDVAGLGVDGLWLMPV